MKTFARVLAGLALSALTFWLFLRNLDFSKVATSLSAASLPLLSVSIVLGYCGHISLRARRWRTMLHPLKDRVSFYNLFSTTAIGYAISGITPGRLGEIVRPVLLARREGIPVAGVVATVAIERVLDIVTIVCLAAVAALSAPLWWQAESRSLPVVVPWFGATDLIRAIVWLGVAGLVACTAGLLLLRTLVMEDSRFLAFVARRRAAGGRLTKLWAGVRHLAEGASFLRSPRRTLLVGVESVLIWLLVAYGCWLGLLAARVHIPFPGTFFLVALSAVGISVPTPGGAGTVHIAFQRGLIDLFQVEPNLASAATFLYHPVTIFIPPIVVGLLFAWRDGLRPASLKALRPITEPDRRRGEAPG